MALEIINEQIIGKIDDLNKKLSGKLPINDLELIYLVNSWGREGWFYIKDLKITPCKATKCYDLSKLDTSKITDMDYLFTYSNFNGDISKWNTSNVTSMGWMFYQAKEFNQDINSWDVSKVTNMESMFYKNNTFNEPILWDVSNVINIYCMFFEAKAFEDRFNNGNQLPEETEDLKEWFNENREKMIAIDIKEKEQDRLDTFFNHLNKDIYSNSIIRLHNID